MTTTVVESGTCANCGTALQGRFCARCGQEDRPLDPTLGEVVTEVAREISALDGRIVRSVRRLFLSPGFLTNQHLAGHRVRWVSPVRLYLIFSVAYFAAASLTGVSPLDLDFRFTGSDEQDASDAIQSLGFASREEMDRAINRAVETWIPRAMFVLVPFFAWLVSRVRRRSGRNYPQHLIFSLHVFAAAFGAESLAIAAGYVARSVTAATIARVAAHLYVLSYFVLAMRAVYGGTIGRALLHTLVVGLFYWLATIVVAAAIIAPVFWR